MKLTIRPHMLPQELLTELPGRLRSLARMANLPDVPHVVLLFSGSEPVRSRFAERAVRRLDRLDVGSRPVLAVAEDMTREAAALLHAREIRIIALNTGFWSDESWKQVKTLIGCRVKRPDHR